jgi:hypothetical protein
MHLRDFSPLVLFMGVTKPIWQTHERGMRKISTPKLEAVLKFHAFQECLSGTGAFNNAGENLGH